MFGFVNAKDLQFEERAVTEAIGLAFHGLDLGVGAFQRSKWRSKGCGGAGLILRSYKDRLEWPAEPRLI